MFWISFGAALAVWLTYAFSRACAADREAGRNLPAWGHGIIAASFAVQAVVLLEWLMFTR